MIIQNTSSQTYTPPSEGAHDAVCCDIIDLGVIATEFGDKRKCRIVFELMETRDDGSPQTVQQTFNVSLHAKATLGKFLSAWRGAPIADGETVDLESFIGRSASLYVTHETNLDGKVFANIKAVSKPKTKTELSGKYDAAGARTRIAERAAKLGLAQVTPAQAQAKTNDAVLQSFPAARPAAAAAVKTQPQKNNDDVQH